MKITYYLEVSSSWCYWAEPAWAELKSRYAGKMEFHWKIAQMPAEAYPISKDQCDWFYRRSGTIVRSPFMLNSGWWEADIKQYSAPNLVAEAARDMGAGDDRVRLALAYAGMREGKQIGRDEVCAEIASAAAGLDRDALVQKARSSEIAARVRASSEEFDSLRVTQRPTFLLENGIGDHATLSGLATAAPIAAVIDAMLADEAAYASYATHFGPVPTT